jgi:hypothetical protein
MMAEAIQPQPQVVDSAEGMAAIDKIVGALQVVAKYNDSVHEIINSFVIYGKAIVTNDPILVEDTDAAFDILTKLSRELADAVHDFVYEVTNPRSGIIVKNLAREHVARDVLGIS